MKLFAAAAAFAALVLGQNDGKTQLKVGDMAPDFTLRGASATENKEYKLSDYRGKKMVVLAFFPAAFTGG
jgi:peroxiredoxin Q/BCP